MLVQVLILLLSGAVMHCELAETVVSSTTLTSMAKTVEATETETTGASTSESESEGVTKTNTPVSFPVGSPGSPYSTDLIKSTFPLPTNPDSSSSSDFPEQSTGSQAGTTELNGTRLQPNTTTTTLSSTITSETSTQITTTETTDSTTTSSTSYSSQTTSISTVSTRTTSTSTASSVTLTTTTVNILRREDLMSPVSRISCAESYSFVGSARPLWITLKTQFKPGSIMPIV
eukprot:m.620183 g.620183  ORF g.620183 m.620183 type:complete len:231 (-) comp22532_c0_seq2:2473-3165(-)